MQAQNESQRETHSKTVIAQVQLVENMVAEGIMGAIMFQASSGMMGDEMSARDITGVQKEIDKLTQLTAHDSLQTDNIHKMLLASRPMFENRRNLVVLTGKERKAYREKMEREGYPQEKDFLTAGLAVVDQENETRRRNPEQKEFYRYLINVLIGLAIATSIIVAFVFIEDVFDKCFQTFDSRSPKTANGCPKRQTLEQALEGSDEIAELDAVLHQVDDVVTHAREREEALVENSADIICSIDRDGIFLRVNEASQRNLGYAPKEMIGKTAVAFAAPETANVLLQKHR